MRKAVIFVNGNLSDSSQAKKIIADRDILIATDGGVKHIIKLGLTPDIIIGDFDSTSKTQWSAQIKIIKYPRKKDKTDFELAIDYCLAKKFQEIIIFGILGDRIDHLLANIFLITQIQTKYPEIKIKIIEGNNEIYVLNREITIRGRIGDEISIIPVSDRLVGITTYGLEYQLINETL